MPAGGGRRPQPGEPDWVARLRLLIAWAFAVFVIGHSASAVVRGEDVMTFVEPVAIALALLGRR